jgi:hypothetical protein
MNSSRFTDVKLVPLADGSIARITTTTQIDFISPAPPEMDVAEPVAVEVEGPRLPMGFAGPSA